MQMTALLHYVGQKVPSSVALGLGVVAATVILSTTAIKSDNEKDVAVGNSVNLSSKLTELCSANDDTSKVLHSARTPDGKGLCDAASSILVNPTTQAIATVSDSRITALIRTELAKRPPAQGTSPSLSQVTDAVRTVMTSNPVLFRGEKGDAGTTPSSAEVSSLVSAYIRANPLQFQGKPGENGKPGEDGKPGENGKDGAPCPSGAAQQQIQVSGYVMLACVVGRAPEDPPTTPPTETVTQTVEPTPTEVPDATQGPESTETDTPSLNRRSRPGSLPAT